MAEPDQPKKETVRIELPIPPSTRPPEPSVKPRETVRIQLPVRETGNPSVPTSPHSVSEDVASANFFQSPKPQTAAPPLSGSVRPAPIPASSGPRRETVHIPLAPEPMRSARKETQPLIAPPKVVPQYPPIAEAPAQKRSMLLYWMLLGISALILIIQIWTYFS